MLGHACCRLHEWLHELEQTGQYSKSSVARKLAMWMRGDVAAHGHGSKLVRPGATLPSPPIAKLTNSDSALSGTGLRAASPVRYRRRRMTG